MLSASAHAAHAVRSSSPLNPRSSSPPPSSPTPGGYSSLSGTPSRLPAFGRSNTTPTPLSARYRTTPNSSLASRRPGLNGRLPSSPGEFFSPDTTPTESAMWRDKFARRLADSQRRRNARDADLARRRGTEPLPDMDDPDAEERAMQEDEEIFRRLMILQRRKAQHAALVSYEQETGGSDPLLPEFWEEELSALEREEMQLLQEIEMAEAAEVEALAAAAEVTGASGASVGVGSASVGMSPTSFASSAGPADSFSAASDIGGRGMANGLGVRLNGTSAASLSGFAPGSYAGSGGGAVAGSGGASGGNGAGGSGAGGSGAGGIGPGGSGGRLSAEEHAMRVLEQCGEYEPHDGWDVGYDDWEHGIDDEPDEVEIAAMEAAAREAERAAALAAAQGVGFGAPGYVPPTAPTGPGNGFGQGRGFAAPVGDAAEGDSMDVD